MKKVSLVIELGALKFTTHSHTLSINHLC